MAYSEKIAERVRKILSNTGKVSEKKMFGKLAFMVNGKMCVTVGADKIMCRIDPSVYSEVILRKGCSPMIMRGREYKGFLYVDENSIDNKKDLDYWIKLSLDYNKVARSAKTGRKK